MNYADFLESKRITIAPSGFEVKPSNPHLFPFQRDLVRWSLRIGKAAIWADCGLGKSLMELSWAQHVVEHFNAPVLILAPLSVSHQTAREGEKFGIPCRVVSSQAEVDGPGIYITNYEKLVHYDLPVFPGVVLDECFPAGTMLDTPNGKRDIASIQKGDIIWNAYGLDTVITTKRKKISKAVYVKTNSQSQTIASENHPFFTARGYVRACDIRLGDLLMETATAMRLVQENNNPSYDARGNEAFLRSLLSVEMVNVFSSKTGEASLPKGMGEDWAISQCVVKLRFPQGGSGDQGFCFSQEGERARLNIATTDIARPARPNMESRASSLLLQDRYSALKAKDCYRDRWQYAFSKTAKALRCKEGSNAGFVRVESVEILEQGHPELEKLRDADGSLYFYDIQAARHPSFSVNGCLVHNSSILKSFTGVTRNALIESFINTPMKLCCSATPAPNDRMELGNHSEFLGVLTRTEMLSTFFVHDGGDTSKWRLKGHAQEEYWRWMCGWAVMMRRPSDLGYADDKFVLPPLNYHHHVVKSAKNLDGFLFSVEAQTLLERRGARKDSLNERVALCAELAQQSGQQFVIWCGLNVEQDSLAKLLGNECVSIYGSLSDNEKESRLAKWLAGEKRILISKVSIFGWGLNLQQCANVAFLGISDSFEEMYQGVRRCWRFGQTREVNCHVITSEAEGAVVRNIQRKEADAARMAKEMVKHMSVYNTEAVRGTVRTADTYKTRIEKGEGWEMRLGDCIEQIADVESESVHYSIFSPPFIALYTYSASDRDMGNARSDSEFYEHFQFLVKELYRVLLPGRGLSFHCMDIPAMKERDGYIGLKDFPGDLIRMFQAAGFIYHSRATIWKDPLVEATRTKAIGLMHKQVVKDSAISRQGLPDYLITMRKPGANSEPISRPQGFTEFIGDDEPQAPRKEPTVRSRDIEKYMGQTSDDPVYSHQVWRRYASPVWTDINPSNTLQKESAREEADERHIAPLQLQVIERGIELWSNKGDLVLDPFGGIGSTGHVALRRERQFIGFELKESYFKQACANLRAAATVSQTGLFATVAGE